MFESLFLKVWCATPLGYVARFVGSRSFLQGDGNAL
jgi:hypothetical protein